VLKTVIDAAAGRVPVIAGSTAESTRAAISRVRRATELGASAAMIAPARAAASPALQLAHFTAIAEAAEIPIVIQDEPVTTGVKMQAATLGEMGKIAGLDVVKVEEVPSPTKVSAILEANSDLACFGGLGGLYMLEELNRGAVGIMTGFGYPEVLVKIYSEYASGDTAAAQATFFHYMPLIRYEAQLGVGGVSIRKRLLVERGIIGSATARQPAASGDPRAIGELQELIDILGL
ncbi:MAG: dihydrodipicolinate synthetase, partial [Pseudonocardiales bacterium]|nr:dihydrodipicolinate synthetase [Pseudonocardiales bacterium]